MKLSANPTGTRQTKREGVILLIVMAMLALFASVGLTFVFYAESEANIARTARQGESLYRADVEPELLLNHFLTQVLYDTDDLSSSLRGHSLARKLYAEDPARRGLNGVPFNGAGVLNYKHTTGGITNADNATLINFRYFPADGFLRDPGYHGVRSNPGAAKGRFLGGDNPPWTYPGLNNVFLAAVNASGEVLTQSYYRSWLSGDQSDGANPNMTNVIGHYLTLRPRPTDNGPGFPLAENAGGDVKNLPYGPGVKKAGGGHYPNDSFWMYTGFPVLTAANGKKYTVLFAPLIMDLDNRVNLSVHGNLMAGGTDHLSHQGFGRWEVNPLQLVGLLDPNEWKNRMMTGSTGRYGTNGVPDYPPLTYTPFPVLAYSQYDWNANAGPWTTPTPDKFSIFPVFSAQWNSGRTTAPEDEWANHASKYSYWNPQADDNRKLIASHMEGVLRGGGKGSPALTSDLFKIMPNSMSNAKLRNLVTLLSHDFNRQGVVPFINPASHSYKWNAAKKFPEAPAGTYPDPNVPLPASPQSDFTNNTYASVLGGLSRINLNKVLTQYPDLDANGDFVADPSAMVLERQNLAKEIYAMLLIVTGAKDPNVDASIADPSPEYQAARWLAQLAVNIVDYIDADDVMTPFAWHTMNLPMGGSPEFVFGTEPTRLVINEAYAQLDNDPRDPGFKDMDETLWRAEYYRMNCWVELHNPLPPTPAPAAGRPEDKYPLDGGKARLVSTQPVYRLVLSKPDPDLRAPTNQIGAFKADKSLLFKQLIDPKADCIVTDWPDDAKDVDDAIVHPVDDANRFEDPAKNGRGFYVVGPREAGGFYDKPSRDPGIAVTNFPASSGKATSNALTAKVDLADAGVQPTILLQRLACPYRPFNDDPTNPAYNPYVTVDYVENVKLNQMMTHNPAPIAMPPAFNTANAVGRRQPYGGGFPPTDQNPDGAAATTPKHTFHRQNCKEVMPPVDFAAAGQTLDAAEWLPHLDRPLRNPLELLHISMYRPHELTQQFITPGGKYQHYAPWDKSESLLYRFLEMVHQADFMQGSPFNGRTPGKINLNTVWDIETFKALVDWNNRSGFTAADVDAAWLKIQQSRTPTGIPSANDKPFYPLGIGYLAAGGTNPYSVPTGLTSTLLREDSADPTKRMLDVPGATHPLKRLELLQKINLNTTTRSNVFAVWVTAGFFEVTDDTTTPIRLGREIGKDDNRQIRHKFFAIVDRTEIKARISADGQVNGPERRLVLGSGGVTYTPGAAGAPSSITDGGTANLQYTLLSGDKFTVVPGTYVTIAPDTANEETVVVTNVKGNTFEFQATKAHGANEEVIFRCWTGPWSRYDVRRDEKVVPYFTVVD